MTESDPQAELSDPFDYLVGTKDEPSRNIVTDRLGRLKIDHQLKPCRLFDRKIVGFTKQSLIWR
jgi:hypothetical protein